MKFDFLAKFFADSLGLLQLKFKMMQLDSSLTVFPRNDEHKTAFSLVEILVALIIVSLIMAALAPVITKKLSSAGITIVGGGSGGNAGEQWGEPRNQADCDPYNALFMPKEENGLGGKNLCFTLYNAGDSSGPTIPANIEIKNTSTTCTNSNGMCCWKGSNANTDTCTTSGAYNACTRTTCQREAAADICAKWQPEGYSAPGFWRLPTVAEAQGWVNRGIANMNMCSATVGVTPNCCGYSYKNPSGKGNGAARAHDIWLAEQCNNLNCPTFTFGEQAVISNRNGSSPPAVTYFDGASVRCVTDNIPYPETIGGNGSSTPSEPEITTDCSSVHEKCTFCRDGKCLSCEDGYIITDDGKCEEDVPEIKWKVPESQADCEYVNGHYFNGACITKVNVGDENGPPIEDIGIDIKTVGSSCTTNTCCWRGTTSASCESFATSTYDACTRTVCTHSAGDLACKNYDINGTKGKWSLPSNNDFNSWIAQMPNEKSSSVSLLQYFLGSNGLDLCDQETTAWYSSLCPNRDNVCKNSVTGESRCYPSWLWGKEITSSTAYSFNLKDDDPTLHTEDKNWAYSVRCIIKNVPYIYKKPTTSTPDTRIWKTPSSQKDCDPYSAHYFNGKCITKGNAGDLNGAPIDDLDIQILNVGSECKTNTCCWKGTTAGSYSTFTTSTYSAASRTVCTWYAGDVACKNYDINGTKGMWDLPSSTDFTYWVNQVPSDLSSSVSLLTRFLGSSGADFCDNESGADYGNSVCLSKDGKCPNKVTGENKTCYPSWIWGKEDTINTAHSFTLEYDEARQTIEDKKYAYAIRCVLDKVEDTGEEIQPEVDATEYVTPTKQSHCDPYNAHYFNNKCISKGNVGDLNGAPIDNIGIQVLNVGNSCTTNTCCWRGTTSSSGCSTFTTSSYSGCNRVVCSWYGADLACKNYDINGTKGKWSLPDATDFAAWVNQVPQDISATAAILTRYMGSKGLDLCDVNSDSTDGNAKCPSKTSGCKINVSGETACYPGWLWGKEATSITAYSFVLEYDAARYITEDKSYAYSARCVLNKVKKDDISGETESETIKTKVPTSQADCSKYNALYFNNSCITKANAGDANGPNINNVGIQVLNVGSSCTTNSCCWKGATSGSGCSTYTTSSYDGCTRTVCNQPAGELACKNYDINGTKGLWSLPSNADFQAWIGQLPKDTSSTNAILTRFLGSNGLDLCDTGGGVSYGNAACPSRENVCKNTNTNTNSCYAGWYWGKEATSNTAYSLDFDWNAGIMHTEAKVNYAYSIRCVTHNIPDE